MSPFIASWGIIGCGFISGRFVRDLVLHRPEIRDVAHSIIAVAARNQSRAKQFIAHNCPDGASAQLNGLDDRCPNAYGSYEEVYNHPDVSIVYIGTLHPSHFTETKSAIEAGKNVVVEKPAVLNAAEWEYLSKLAKSKNVFLMEAGALRKLLHEDKVIGDVKMVKADYSAALWGYFPDAHRSFRIEDAGGCWMDLGIYVLFPALLTLYHAPENRQAFPADIQVSMLFSRMKTDLTTSVLLNFPNLEAQASLSVSYAYDSPKDERVQIIGSKGYEKRPPADPDSFEPQWESEKDVTMDFAGMGHHWEADASARCLRDGELESKDWSHEDTLLMLQVHDRVRKIGGYEYPPGMVKVT
ncbi:hypothetical protein J002_05641 [Cryptococcus neoformans]|nr:hypothetical protein J002_05641 [Cryptococcus neoformans var. grubii]OXH61247.1 hypothetical protein J004_00004 [Cryptococcus neoformans var. grubii]